MKKNKIISIGWDVGGWLGKKNALAALKFDGENFSWHKEPFLHKIGGCPFDLDSFLNLFEIKDIEEYKIIISIDAPLGFPVSFQFLVSKAEGYNYNQIYCSHYDEFQKHMEINNLLAYRYSERIIMDVFNKKPLSAVFDKLGNNATVAMSHIRTWQNDKRITILPFNSDFESSQVIEDFTDILAIEVYPGILKDGIIGKNILKETFIDFLSLLPENIPSSILEAFKYYYNPMIEVNKSVKFQKTDELDACICAILGMAYLNPNNKLFELQKPYEHVFKNPILNFKPEFNSINMIKSEGWIYYPKTIENGNTRND